MSQARTLLSIYGVPSDPSALSRSVVILIDVQNSYRVGLPLNGIEPAIAVTRRLLDRARAVGAPIIHVVQRGVAGGLFDLDGESGKIVDEATPVTGETVIVKTVPSSFVGTDLAKLIAETGRKEIIVAGFMTHMCVSTTVRDSIDHGLRTTVVADAVASRDLPDPFGGDDISGETVSRVALAELADRFAIVAPLDAIPD